MSLAGMNKCTLSVKKKNRAKWTGEYLHPENRMTSSCHKQDAVICLCKSTLKQIPIAFERKDYLQNLILMKKLWVGIIQIKINSIFEQEATVINLCDVMYWAFRVLKQFANRTERNGIHKKIMRDKGM